MRTRMSVAVVAACLVLVAGCAASRTGGGAAALGAGGYDVVAYFTAGEATKGSRARTATHEGREWRFARAEHRRMFLEEPERYTPAYEGHCAWSMSEGRLAQGRPQHWAIHDGRLFLNCNAEIHARWLEDRERRIELADREWAQRGGD